ncbi:hypothetical protein [uncultured Ruminococcus sp.]|uniref:hypothetical protein n=1 Tax=uncultured Ruminococcus sp. TaxID=165186 RepID=UPI0025DD8259|nr:hypothetical protein [uncultured Ruminococcus sp.]
MDIKTKITLDMLTTDSVSVLKQQYITVDETDIRVGENVRNAYMNTQTERELLKSELPEEFYNAVIAVWGDTPTIAEPAEVI